MATRPAALAKAQLAEREGEVIDHDQHLVERRALPGEDLANRDAGLVHERHRLHEQQVEALVPAADGRRRVLVPGTA